MNVPNSAKMNHLGEEEESSGSKNNIRSNEFINE